MNLYELKKLLTLSEDDKFISAVYKVKQVKNFNIIIIILVIYQNFKVFYVCIVGE